MRKNAFASVCLFGTDNNSSISGIWVWRGQGLAFEVSYNNTNSNVMYFMITNEHIRFIISERDYQSNNP